MGITLICVTRAVAGLLPAVGPPCFRDTRRVRTRVASGRTYPSESPRRLCHFGTTPSLTCCGYLSATDSRLLPTWLAHRPLSEAPPSDALRLTPSPPDALSLTVDMPVIRTPKNPPRPSSAACRLLSDVARVEGRSRVVMDDATVFTYTNAVSGRRKPSAGCSCVGQCLPQKCECRLATSAYHGADPRSTSLVINRRLRVGGLEGSRLIECSNKCGCSKSCQNRVRNTMTPGFICTDAYVSSRKRDMTTRCPLRWLT
jgi:hypothetical protein